MYPAFCRFYELNSLIEQGSIKIAQWIEAIDTATAPRLHRYGRCFFYPVKNYPGM